MDRSFSFPIIIVIFKTLLTRVPAIYLKQLKDPSNSSRQLCRPFNSTEHKTLIWPWENSRSSKRYPTVFIYIQYLLMKRYLFFLFFGLLIFAKLNKKRKQNLEMVFWESQLISVANVAHLMNRLHCLANYFQRPSKDFIFCYPQFWTIREDINVFSRGICNWCNSVWHHPTPQSNLDQIERDQIQQLSHFR